MSNKDTFAWKFHDGTHFYVRLNAVGVADSVLGVISPVDDDKYVACIHNNFDSYSEFEELDGAKNYVSAIVALEAEHNA